MEQKEMATMSELDLSQDVYMELDADFKRLIDSLLTVLARETVIYEELQDIVRKERQTLKKPSVQLISESNNRKETCILKARMLEEVRTNLVRKLARHLGREEREINLTLLASLADEEQGGALRTHQERLTQLLESIREINAMNQDLLDYSLSYVKNSINFLNQIMSTGADYVNTGKLKNGSRNGAVICRRG
jgi:flagellar biosynthesis/type III secretory pathway chaperone